MIIKCKMCSGEIEFVPGATYGTCEYCGTKSTLPKAEDENKLNRYNRANHFRRQCEFDKAIAAYEKLLESDDTDAEAHWGAVLSRYGIEYVEDPTTKKRIPTCHRVQMTSILADADYKAAVKHAPDAESRRIYEEQAAQIAEIQKGILAVSANEKPYDVFICYKETDENGQRTHDSQWAQDVYYGLTEQGYKVFFSRITLEDKIGREYEPYIFAALNSAKVMVVIGSKPEYFNAVWVKNEWSRYLAIMAKDRKRLLIPCYRDMDPYDLPDELSSLQSQDMGKIGFMQDLLRGIKKVLDASKKPEQPAVVQQVVQADAAAVAPGVKSLLDRAYLFMEDGDFNSADEYLNRVLDIDPKYAPAYAAKVCVALHLRKESALASTPFQYADNADWQKAIRFAEPKQKEIYLGYANKVKERVQLQIRNIMYDCAVEMAMNPHADADKLKKEIAIYKAACARSNGNRINGNRRANYKNNETKFSLAIKHSDTDVSEQNLKTAAIMFEAVGDDAADACAKQCLALAEIARQKKVYADAMTTKKNGSHSISLLESAAKQFLSVPDYKDAKEQAQKCYDEAEGIRIRLYDKAVYFMNQAGTSSVGWQTAKEHLAKTELTGFRDVAQLREKAAKSYDECYAAEQEARRQAAEKAKHEAEEEARRKKRFNTVLVILLVLAAVAFFVVTKVIIPNQKYDAAMELMAAGKYEEAIAAFSEIETHKDSAERIEGLQLAIKHAKYDAAVALMNEGKYEEAYEAFVTLNGHKDSAAKASAILNEHPQIKYANAKVGDLIIFGTYEQDANTGNGKEDIEWLVLAKENNRLLVISRYVLDCKPYNEKKTNTTWETCTLRKWLNNDFLKSAFSSAEQAIIPTVTVSADKNSVYNTKTGNATQDMAFLLSFPEVNTYFTSDSTRQCIPTVYARKQGVYTNSSGLCWWWLRSPGNLAFYAAYVTNNGGANEYGLMVNRDDGAGRPALWINLEP